MAQGLAAGMTDYSKQTIGDIKSDIEYWIKYSEETKNEFSTIINDLEDCGYWKKNVPLNFQIYCHSIGQICDTFCSDFRIIIAAIDGDAITKREITLMNNIFEVASKNEEQSWQIFKENEDWKEFMDPMYQKAETLYAHARDFFFDSMGCFKCCGKNGGLYERGKCSKCFSKWK